jgi:hypothetical protein
MNSAAAKVRATKSQGTGLSGVAPDCPVPQGDKAPTVDFAPNPNGWVTWRCTGQPTSACPVRPSRAASSTTTLVVGGYKYPNHHNSKHPSFLKFPFNTRALAFTPRHNSKDQSLSKSQIHLKQLVTCVCVRERERDFVFF